jgi:diadenosine tetraphosphate (Ap4A) HIT family hydrolase
VNSVDQSCALCRAVDERLAKGRRHYDTHLYSSANFVVIPSVGPIAPGHVMVVSRLHLPNLASVGASEIYEYNSLVGFVAKRKPYSSSGLLEAEHGSSQHDSGGACITHVHINLIPGFGSFANMFDGRLPQMEIDANLGTLKPSAAPYILMRGLSVVRLYKAQAVPSQLIRRVLFEKMGRDDWDWGIFPRHEVVGETLRIWGFESHV